MKCPKCRTENPEGMKFCGECGQKFEIKCPKCGFSNSPSFKFCGECGYQLTQPPEASPVDYSAPQSYTPKHLAEKILIPRSSIEGERKLVTVMFADVAGFTSCLKSWTRRTSTGSWTAAAGFWWMKSTASRARSASSGAMGSWPSSGRLSPMKIMPSGPVMRL